MDMVDCSRFFRQIPTLFCNMVVLKDDSVTGWGRRGAVIPCHGALVLLVMVQVRVLP